LRILFCNYEYPPLGGGGGVINALLGKELASRHSVTVLTSRAGDLPAEAVEGGVRVLRVPVLFRRDRAKASMVSMLSYVLRAPAAWRRHGRDGVDVINTHFVLPSGPVGDVLARRLGVPNVLSVHGGDLYDPSKLTSPHRHAILKLWVRRLARRADAVVGQSRNTLENLKTYFTPEIQGERIPLGIRAPSPGEADRAQYGLAPDDFLLVTVGRVVARKAMHQLLAVVHEIGDPRVKLLVIGSGPVVPALQRECGTRGLGDRVRFLGNVEETEKFRVLRMCDLFVSSSQHEGFGIVFLEAMACGLPVVCYDFGGQTDFLSDGVTGHLPALNDIEAFTARCRDLIADDDARRRMGAGNLLMVEEFFIGNCAARYERLFERVLDERGCGAGTDRAVPAVRRDAPCTR